MIKKKMTEEGSMSENRNSNFYKVFDKKTLLKCFLSRKNTVHPYKEKTNIIFYEKLDSIKKLITIKNIEAINTEKKIKSKPEGLNLLDNEYVLDIISEFIFWSLFNFDWRDIKTSIKLLNVVDINKEEKNYLVKNDFFSFVPFPKVDENSISYNSSIDFLMSKIEDQLKRKIYYSSHLFSILLNEISPIIKLTNPKDKNIFFLKKYRTQQQERNISNQEWIPVFYFPEKNKQKKNLSKELLRLLELKKEEDSIGINEISNLIDPSFSSFLFFLNIFWELFNISPKSYYATWTEDITSTHCYSTCNHIYSKNVLFYFIFEDLEEKNRIKKVYSNENFFKTMEMTLNMEVRSKIAKEIRNYKETYYNTIRQILAWDIEEMRLKSSSGNTFYVHKLRNNYKSEIFEKIIIPVIRSISCELFNNLVSYMKKKIFDERLLEDKFEEYENEMLHENNIFDISENIHQEMGWFIMSRYIGV